MEPKLLLSPEEAAERLSIGRSFLWELLRRGEIESIHLGRRRLVPVDALVSYVERQREAVGVAR
jgi:excisionase family DNA binding protein